jgi:hypothetical protein
MELALAAGNGSGPIEGRSTFAQATARPVDKILCTVTYGRRQPPRDGTGWNRVKAQTIPLRLPADAKARSKLPRSPAGAEGAEVGLGADVDRRRVEGRRDEGGLSQVMLMNQLERIAGLHDRDETPVGDEVEMAAGDDG